MLHRSLLGILLLVSLAGFSSAAAQAREHSIHEVPGQGPAWTSEGYFFDKDTVLLPQGRFTVVERFGSYEVYLVQGESGERVVLKTSRGPTGSFTDLGTSAQGIQRLQEQGIAVPRIIDSPEHQLYTLREYIPGPTYQALYQAQGDTDAAEERDARLRSLLILMESVENSSLFASDFNPKNVVYDAAHQRSVFIDPGLVRERRVFNGHIESRNLLESFFLNIMSKRMERDFERAKHLKCTGFLRD